MNSFIISGNSITYHSYNDNLISKAIDMDCDIIYNKYSTTVVFPTIQALQYFVSDIVMNNETLELPSNTLTTDAEFYDQLSKSRKTYFNNIFDDAKEEKDPDVRNYNHMLKTCAEYYKNLSIPLDKKQVTENETKHDDPNYDFLRQMNNCDCGAMLNVCENLLKQPDFNSGSDNVIISSKTCKCSN